MCARVSFCVFTQTLSLLCVYERHSSMGGDCHDDTWYGSGGGRSCCPNEWRNGYTNDDNRSGWSQGQKTNNGCANVATPGTHRLNGYISSVKPVGTGSKSVIPMSPVFRTKAGTRAEQAC